MNMKDNADFGHIPVMLAECVDALAIKGGGVYVDGTAGGGSHSEAIARALMAAGGGTLCCIDRDADAIAACKARLGGMDGVKVVFIRDNFRNLASALRESGIDEIDGLLLDLGVSSHQLDTPERGFSYNTDAPLDMRMDTSQPLTAADVVNGYPESELRRIIAEYGEEKFAPRIASFIVREREKEPIETTARLAAVVKAAIPAAAARAEAQHPARRTFQAVRIEVNGELDAIEPAIKDAVAMMRKGGRIAVITFHSLEDRIVKNVFADLARGCVCPPDFPVCVCGRTPDVKLLSRKPTLPSEEELAKNKRSHSAKLRAAEKL